MPARNPSSPPRAADLAPARRLWRDYLSRYWPRLALGGAAMAAYAASYSAIPIAVEWINTAIAAYGGGEREALHGLLFLAPALIIGLGVVNAAAQYVQSRLTASAALAAMRDLQADMHARLLAVDEAQVRALGSGQAVSRFVGDPAALREMLMRVITAARDLMTLAGVCFVMARFDWVLFLVVAAVYAILGWPVSLIGKRLRDSARAAQAQAGDIASLIAETTANARIIRAFNLEAPERARGRAAFDERLKRLDRAWALRAANEPFVFVVGAIAFAIVVATVALRLQSGALDGPQFIAFIIALLMLSQPARGLSTLNAVAQEGLAAFERMVELVDIAPTVRAAAGAPALHVVGGEVVFRDVAFSYDGRQPALDGVSFTAPAGKTLALVGMSGAGKSTLFALLLRAYDAARGEILIDGHDIKAVDISSLRAAIAIVAQEPMLFDDTVAANIARGRAGAVRSQIEDAARAADAHDFIIALPHGYETRIGEGGGLLSGGQRQRIAIARAFLKDAPILLLDEATAALDAASEAQIHAALERLARGRTTIVAAHRLSTVRRADRIVALADGRIIEQGDHEGLVAANGYYARVVRLQMTDS